MLGRRQLPRGGWLPQEGSSPTPAPRSPLQAAYGNAALVEQLIGGGGGQMSAQRFEGIGESTDEWRAGGPLLEGPKGGPGAMYGRVGWDDASLKAEAGVYEGGFGNWLLDLMHVDYQGGSWWDDEGDANAGWQLAAGLADVAYDFRGDPGEDDGYFRLEGGLLDLGLASRIGQDGWDFGANLDLASLGLAAGTGMHADSSSDWSWEASMGVGVGASTGLSWTDADQDGVPELGISAGGAMGLGFDYALKSEQAGQWVCDGMDWLGLGGGR